MQRIFIIVALLMLISPVKAADSPVAGYPDASALSGPELFYCVQSGADHKCTSAQISAYANSQLGGPFTAGELLVGGPGASQIQNASGVAQTAYALAGSTGTVASGTAYNNWSIASDELDCTGSCDGWKFSHSFGGSGLTGARQTLNVLSFFTAASSATNGNRNYAAGVFNMDVNSSDGGTDTGAGAKGAFFGLNPILNVHSGVTNIASITGIEVDIVTQVTTSFKSAVGFSAVSFKAASGTGAAGTGSDAAFRVGTLTAKTPWTTAFLIGRYNGAAPVATTGCLICTDGSADTIATGMDLSPYTISGNFIKGPSSQITGVGLATFTNLTVTGSTLPANGMYLSGANTVGFAVNSTGFAFLSGNTLGLGAPGVINAGDYLTVRANASSAQGATIRNASTNAAATGYLNFSNGTAQGFLSYTSTGAAAVSTFSIGNGGVAAITINTSGLITVPAVATGTAVASLCIDSSNFVIKKTTSGACI